MSIVAGCLNLGRCILLVLLSASNLAAQAPRSYPESGSTGLPRFTLHEIITGSNATLSRIPGPWLHAALAAQPESLALAGYHKWARLSRIEPIEGKALTSERSHHVMGLHQREELTRAVRRTLKAIRSNIPGDTTRARFDHLFRPGGAWVVDLHDAALAWARRRSPELGWATARRALAAAHWVDPADSLSVEAVPRALYGLTVLAATDSAAFNRVRADMGRADSVSAEAVLLLLTGYAESQKWYTDVLEFFLIQPWVRDKGRGRSLADYVRGDWHRHGASDPQAGTPLPVLKAQLFGYPQAVPHYGVPPALFHRLITTHNPGARLWLDRNGQAGLLRTLRWLPLGDTSLVLLHTGTETIRLTTLPRHSRESLNGFLEPGDAIAIDPGYSPLLALGTVVHEWQHLLFRRRQLDAFARKLPARHQAVVELPTVEPYLAEGFAEWSAERILAPLVARWPLLALGEGVKRAGLARENTDDQHSIGYALVLALAAALRDPASTTEILLSNAERPERIASHPALHQAWKAYGGLPDRVFAVPLRKVLIPEVTFTVEDGFPDVIASRILIPPSGKGEK